MLLNKDLLPSNFICVDGVLYVPQYIGLNACKFCDLKTETSQLDCSCICELLGNGRDYCLKTLYTDFKVLAL